MHCNIAMSPQSHVPLLYVSRDDSMLQEKQQTLVADVRPPSVRLADLGHICCNHLADSRCILNFDILLGMPERETIPCRVLALFVMRATLKDDAIGWQDPAPANFIELECSALC